MNPLALLSLLTRLEEENMELRARIEEFREQLTQQALTLEDLQGRLAEHEKDTGQPEG